MLYLAAMAKNITIEIDKIPDEVKKVWAVQVYCQTIRTGVGTELYKECLRTIKQYPEYFPSQHKSLNKEQ